jgi:hypothetical protein
MIKDSIISWPDRDWNYWFLYDRLNNQQYRINVGYLSRVEQKSFFWRGEKLNQQNYKFILDSLKSINLLKKGKEKYSFTIPRIDFFEVTFVDENVNIFIDKGILKSYINQKIKKSNYIKLNIKTYDLNDISSHKNIVNELNFIFLTRFNLKIINNYLNKLHNIIPVFLNESDIFVGPKLYSDICPCINCLFFRLGSSSIDATSFERQIEVAERESLFTKEALIENNTSNMMELLFSLMQLYIIKYSKKKISHENIYIRYELNNSQFYLKNFLAIPHKKVDSIENITENSYRQLGGSFYEY